MNEHGDTQREIERTEQAGQVVYAGTWTGAAIGMVANAGNAVVTFGTLGGNRGVGLAIGVFVDVAVIVALIGDRQLAKHGKRSGWSWAVQAYAMVFGLTIAISAAVYSDHYLLALLLAGVLPLMWLLMGYGQDAAIKFAGILNNLRRSPVDIAPSPAVEPARAPVFEPFPTVVVDDEYAAVSTNGHRGDDGRGWSFVPPAWTTPPPVPRWDDTPVDTDPGQDPTSTVPGDPDPAPGDDPVRDPVDEGVEIGQDDTAPQDPINDAPPGDGLPSLDAVRAWRDQQRETGGPVGRDAIRAQFGLSEREARKVIAALKQPVVVGS